jgi:hypothetical protein
VSGKVERHVPVRAARRRRRRRAGLGAWLARLAGLVVLVGMIPVALTLIYAAPGVRPVSTLMIQDAIILRSYDRHWMPIEELGPNIVNAVIMSEDGQFCFHHGIDWRELYHHRELMYFLTWRDVKVRYKQTALGMLRTQRERSDVRPIWPIAASLGNIGAAVVPVMLGWALAAAKKDYSPKGPMLVEASSDKGACGALVARAS